MRSHCICLDICMSQYVSLSLDIIAKFVNELFNWLKEK